jgi:hypothetical protein
LSSWKHADNVALPELRYLSVAIQLSEFELVDQLNDPAQRERSAQLTAAAIRRSREDGKGVWRQATEQAARRFLQVRTMGVAAADLLEDVDRLATRGDPADAIERLDVILKTLPPSLSAESHGMLMMRRGRLATEVDDWDTAVRTLEVAVPLLSSSSRAAEANLLRCFAIGRQWQQQPLVSDLRQRYEDAVVNHLEQFGTEPGSETAREWLVLLWRNSNRIPAAAQLVQLARDTDDAALSSDRLMDASGLLIDAVLSNQEVTEESRSVANELQHATEQVIQSDESTLADAAVVTVAAEVLSILVEPHEGSDWQPIVSSLKRALGSLQSTPSTTVPGVSRPNVVSETIRNARRLCLVGLLISTARSSADSNDVERFLVELGQLPDGDRLFAASVTAFCLRPNDQLRAGDVVLANAIPLLVPDIESTDMTLTQLLVVLKMATASSMVNGDVALVDAIVNRIMKLRPDESDMLDIATALTVSDAAGGKKVLPPSADIRAFWRRLVADSDSGSDMWLEASLQLANAEFVTGDKARAQQIVRLAEILAPNWGSTERMARANSLKLRMTGAEQ